MFFKTKKDKKKSELIEALYIKHRSLLYSIALEILKDKPLAEDAVQLTFERVLNAKDNLNFDVPEKVRGMLVVICKNAAKDIYKKRRREQLTAEPEKELSLSEYTYNPERIVIGRESLSVVIKSIKDMDEKHRAVLLLSREPGMSVDGISKLLNISFENTKKRLYRARKKLTSDLEQHDSVAENTDRQ